MAAKPEINLKKNYVTLIGTRVDFFSNKNETMFSSGYENCSELGVLGGVILKLDIL